MRIVFAGTPEIACLSLKTLSHHFEIVAVLTNPDAPFGRKQQLSPPPVKVMAKELGLPVLQPAKLTKDFEDQLALLKADLLVCFAYGKIFKESFLSLFPLGAVNLHPSLLPLWRGATPIPSAILHGDKETGITVQKMALKMDSGDIILQKKIALNGQETTYSLGHQVAEESGKLLVEAIDVLQHHPEQIYAQQEENATYCTIIKKEDALLNLHDSAVNLERKIRAMNPNPMAYVMLDDKKIVIYQASVYNDNNNEQDIGTVLSVDKNAGIIVQTGQGCLAIRELQAPSKKALMYKDFINGWRDFVGNRLN